MQMSTAAFTWQRRCTLTLGAPSGVDLQMTGSEAPPSAPCGSLVGAVLIHRPLASPKGERASRATSARLLHFEVTQRTRRAPVSMAAMHDVGAEVSHLPASTIGQRGHLNTERQQECRIHSIIVVRPQHTASLSSNGTTSPRSSPAGPVIYGTTRRLCSRSRPSRTPSPSTSSRPPPSPSGSPPSRCPCAGGC
jgi:hypothetical protein